MPAKKSAANLRAVAGSDEARVKQAAAQHAAKMTPEEAGEFGLETIDGTAENVDQAITRLRETRDALQTLPFMGGAKLVWLKNVNFAADNVMGRSEAVSDARDALLDLLEEGLPDDVRFLISIIDVDKRRTFYKRLGKLAKIEVFDRLDTSRGGWEGDIAALAEQMARDRKLELDSEAMELLVMLVGGDARQLEVEIEKIHLYLGTERRSARADDVRLLVAQTRAGGIFELGNAILRRNLPLALAKLDQLIRQGESGIGILLVSIFPTMRNLLLARDLMERHRLRPPAQPHYFSGTIKRLPEKAVRHLPKKKDGGVNTYALGLAAMQANKFEVEEIRRGLEACLKANLELVTSQLEPRMVLTRLVMTLIR